MKLSRQLPLNALRVFEAVGRLGSFTRAGEELGMTQTAVSYQIKLIEDYVGEALFWRRPRQIGLTETGARLYPRVAEGFGLLTDALQQAMQTAVETLEIHSVPTFASNWLARHLGSFQLQHPNIAVRLQRVSKFREVGALDADIMIPWREKPIPGTVSQPLIQLDFTPVLSPTLAAKFDGITKPADLLKLPIISPDDPWWQEWFAAAGIPEPELVGTKLHSYEAQDLEASAAIAGYGVAIVSPFFFRDELASGRLVQPFPLALKARHPIHLAYPQSRRHAAKIKAFETWIRAALEQENTA
ncbi:LysR substrate-binding domain-containing protein [Peteryoungia ipomoeae]|uniref:LysR family transcriptional regulator n=1 Tax=Peteryoungia ipomoeae TaxID=1210932 RepID=A0A4S8P444_9HYPH|nr:LysR substrate-binding domain-containing protein [Peteryoungia ipomoeae]THV24738.1 LysR family transcriptional regulator [Peteryoungia ipomoeae]